MQSFGGGSDADQPLVGSRPSNWSWPRLLLHFVMEPMVYSIVLFVTGIIAMGILLSVYWESMTGHYLRSDQLLSFPPNPLSWGILVGMIVVVGCFLFLVRTAAKGGQLPAGVAKQASLDGEVVVVTGANTGMGFEVARQTALWGAHVIMACRDREKGEAAVANVKKAISIAGGRGSVEFMEVDLADLESVQRFVEEANRRHKIINILINNAGLMAPPYGVTKQGFESQFGTNHLGHFLLTISLLPALRRANGSRVVNVSSLGHAILGNEKLDLQEVKSVTASTYHGMRFYAISKAANIIFTRELQRRMTNEGIDVYAFAVHPGSVRTELGRHFACADTMKSVLSIFMKTPWEGAQTTLFTAVAPLKMLKPGAYYQDCHEVLPTPCCQDDESAQELWSSSENSVRGFRSL